VRRSNAAVLLLECLLLASIAGLAYAEETPVTLTTDKTTYSPGDTIYVTVNTTYSNYGCAVALQTYVLCLSVVMIPVQSPACSYSCPTASAILLLRPPAYITNAYVQGYQGKAVLELPIDTPAGRYDIELLICPKWTINGNKIGCGGQLVPYQLPKVEIRVEGRTAPNLKSGQGSIPNIDVE
jgi:hypothetical protein